MFISLTFPAVPVPAPIPAPEPAKPVEDIRLAGECDAVLTRFAHVPALRNAIQHRIELQKEFAALKAAKTNFKEIARVGTTYRAAVAAVLKQPLSEDGYTTLVIQYAALVTKVKDTCIKLAEAEEFDALELLGAKLAALRGLKVPALPQSSRALPPVPLPGPRVSAESVRCDALAGEYEIVTIQFTRAATFKDASRRRDELQREYNALKSAATDFVAMGRVGKALKAAVTAVVLTEEDYLTLADRHAALVTTVTATCSVLADAGQFDALEALAAKLEELKALDMSALPRSWLNDPVQPPAPPAAEEEEDDGTNDPVYVPPTTDEVTLV
jgi:hypothetical protein